MSLFRLDTATVGEAFDFMVHDPEKNICVSKSVGWTVVGIAFIAVYIAMFLVRYVPHEYLKKCERFSLS